MLVTAVLLIEQLANNLGKHLDNRPNNIQIMKNLLAVILFSITLSSCETLMMAFSGEQAANFQVVGDKAFVNGVLGKKGHKNFMNTLEEHPNIKTLILQEVPGSISDEWNVLTCKEVRTRGIDTYLESNSVIQSGGVDLFIAGVERFSEEGAKIGVHSWSNLRKDGKEYPPAHEEHQIFVDYFKAIERDTSFYWFTLRAAPADGMHFMTKAEIEKYNLVTDWVN